MDSILAMLSSNGMLIAGAVVAMILVSILLSAMFRVVVSTNDVHIVQHRKMSVSYGREKPAGNVYFKWPTWWPFIGRKVIVLPISNFQITLSDYEAYDKGRVQFLVDIMAFFRIEHSETAAARVHSFDQGEGSLKLQLTGIIQDAVRSILAKAKIEDILEERSKFADEFTAAVTPQLDEWGVKSVKSIALMDIRDHASSKVIHNIMMKKQSLVERESRTEVAENLRAAQEAEIVAKRQVELAAQEAAQQVGQRTAEKDKAVGIAKEQANQAIKEEAKLTATKDMAVQQVQQVRAAEIKKEVQVVAAEEDKQTTVIKAEGVRQVDIVHAEGEKQKTVLVAEGKLEEAKREAEGTRVKGEAEGAAKYAIEVAPVNAQIVLAKEIGENAGYQGYLVEIRKVEANQAVGVAQAASLEKAGIKVIVNSGDVSSGVSNIMDVFSPKGGTAVGGALEALAQTDMGKAVLSALTKGASDKAEAKPAASAKANGANGSSPRA